MLFEFLYTIFDVLVISGRPYYYCYSTYSFDIANVLIIPYNIEYSHNFCQWHDWRGLYYAVWIYKFIFLVFYYIYSTAEKCLMFNDLPFGEPLLLHVMHTSGSNLSLDSGYQE